jgi:hypothetical protein
MSLTQNYVNNNLISSTQNSTNIQTITLNITNADGCPITTNQSITNTQQLKAELSANSNVAFTNSLQQSLDSTVTQNASMINGFAAATGGNETNVTNDVRNIINETVSQTLTNNNIMQIAQNSYNAQTATLTMAFCKNSPIQMNQTIVSNVISQNILNSVSEALLANSTISALISHADQTASMKNQGLNDLVDSMGKALSSIIGAYTGPMAGVAIGITVLLCVCCLALLYFMMSPAGQQATVIGAKAGASAVGKMY